MIKRHLEALGLSQGNQDQFQTIKTAFTKKIRAPFTYRSDRIKYNLAFEYLCNRLFKVQESKEEKQLIQAIYKGDIEFLKSQLKLKKKSSNLQFMMKNNKNDIVNFRKKGTNYPLLYLAVRSGHYDVVQLILESGCNLDFSKDRSTPMHCAAFYGHQHLIPLLFKYGIPTNIKNFSENIPEQEACRQSIKTLLSSSQSDIFYKLVQSLMNNKIAIGTLNLSLKQQKSQNHGFDIRKIILKDYFDDHQNYVDAFHGTSFNALQSIALHGLRAPGQKVNGSTLKIVEGHIPLGKQVRGYKDWAKAIFVSPSIFYAGDPCYSKEVYIDGFRYCPLVQVKVKKGTYSAHNHTFLAYDLKDNQPKSLQFRVKCDNKQESEHIYRSPDYRNVRVIAILLVRQKLLNESSSYQETTNFILNSQDQQVFRIKAQMKNLHV